MANKKAMAFVIDIMISVFIVFSLLKLSNLYISPQSDMAGIDVNMLNRAFEVVRILEEKKKIITPIDINAVANEINGLLNNEYAMYLKINKYNKNNVLLSSQMINTIDRVNNPFPSDKNALYGSKYYFVNYESSVMYFYEVEYFIWQI